MDDILQQLHDSEINASVETFYDGVWNVKIGDKTNGFKARATVANWTEAAQWLARTAMRLYPTSEFAKKIRAANPDMMPNVVVPFTGSAKE
jgi:hypothetical protein